MAVGRSCQASDPCCPFEVSVRAETRTRSAQNGGRLIAQRGCSENRIGTGSSETDQTRIIAQHGYSQNRGTEDAIRSASA